MLNATGSADRSAPRDFTELRERLASGEFKLAKRLRQVADFVLARPDEVALGTVARIARDAGVQPSALVRFSQALGFSGYTDLQAIFRERLRNHVSSYDERMRSPRGEEANGSLAWETLTGLRAATSQSLADMCDRIDPGNLERAAGLLAAAQTIYVVGQRRSFPVSSYISYTLSTLGLRNVLIGSPAGLDAETVSFATAQDAAIAISFTPYAPLTVDYVKRLSAAGVPLVAVTDSLFSPIRTEADAWFEVVEPNHRGFRSMAATLTLAQSIAIAAADIRKSER